LLLLFRTAESLRTENLFLRRQLALYIERGVQPHRVDAATRISLALLARRFDWRGALVAVQPQDLCAPRSPNPDVYGRRVRSCARNHAGRIAPRVLAFGDSGGP